MAFCPSILVSRKGRHWASNPCLNMRMLTELVFKLAGPNAVRSSRASNPFFCISATFWDCRRFIDPARMKFHLIAKESPLAQGQETRSGAGSNGETEVHRLRS